MMFTKIRSTGGVVKVNPEVFDCGGCTALFSVSPIALASWFSHVTLPSGGKARAEEKKLEESGHGRLTGHLRKNFDTLAVMSPLHATCLCSSVAHAQRSL